MFGDDEGVLRADHHLHFMRWPVLHMHYRLDRPNETEVDGSIASELASADAPDLSGEGVRSLRADTDRSSGGPRKAHSARFDGGATP